MRNSLKITCLLGAGVVALVILWLAFPTIDRTSADALNNVSLDQMSVEPNWNLRGTLASNSTLADVSGSASDNAVVPSTLHPPLPASPIRTALLVCHVLALILAMGSTLFLDVYLLKRLYSANVDVASFQLIQFGGRLVQIGLVLLWLSGFGFIAYYALASPEALANQKLWAKIVVVCCLTLNGLLIHQQILPALRKSIGKPLLTGLPTRKAVLFTGSAALSSTSWMFAFILGLVKELNFAFAASTFLGAYLALVALVFLALIFHHHLMVGTANHYSLKPMKNVAG